MPARLTAEQLAAALAAGAPPVSDDYSDDDKWHAAQDSWLARWKPGLHLPATNDPKRRTDWNALSKKGLRHFEAAAAAKAQDEASGGSAAHAPSAPPPPRSPAAQPQEAAPAPTVPARKREYDAKWEQQKLRKILFRRGVTVKRTDTNARLIEKLAAHAKPARTCTRGATSLVAMPPEQPALELVSATVRAIHDLREQCRTLGIEYSIAETSEQLTEKLRARA